MKLAVLFPGVAYYTDMPLLYYGAKVAKEEGYEIVSVVNGEFPKNIKGSKEKMQEAVRIGVSFAEESLKDVDFAAYDEIVFISKSIGTAIGVSYAKKMGLNVKHIIYTPVEETFDSYKKDEIEGIVFHGTKDPWAETQMVERECIRLDLPLYEIPNTNHSLEDGDVLADICVLNFVMSKTKNYFQEK